MFDGLGKENCVHLLFCLFLLFNQESAELLFHVKTWVYTRQFLEEKCKTMLTHIVNSTEPP